MNIDDLLNYKLKKILGDDFDKIDATDKGFGLSEAKRVIQNYCHRLDIPNQLYGVWSDMAIDYIKQFNPSIFSKEEEEDTLGKVASITDGDTNISFSTSNNDPDTLLEIANNAVLKWETQLQSYRKIPNGCGGGGLGV